MKKKHQQHNALQTSLEKALADFVYIPSGGLEHNGTQIIGSSPQISHVRYLISKVAPVRASVLILGETGTGKELVAKAIHAQSPRRLRHMISINCAGLPNDLIENEMFGHEKGAFTGAINRQIGRFELANGSTLFLDEVGELSLPAQAKLLRVLQEGTFERLGSQETLQIDVRIIAATNKNLESKVQEGTFRDDLYYRLNAFPICLPPLRVRLQDIDNMVEIFAQEFSRTMGKSVQYIPRKAVEALKQHSWPGNVRELRNTVARAVILANDTTIYPHVERSNSTVSKPERLQDAEREHILNALVKCSGRVSGEKGAAKLLDINPNTLVAKMKKLGIKRSAYFTHEQGQKRSHNQADQNNEEWT